MKVFILPYGKINILQDNIAEIIINQGIVMDTKMVNHYHDFLLENLKSPFSLLVNKEHSYSYKFDAQLQIANLKEVKSMAVVIYNLSAEMGTQILIDINKGNNWNIKLFKERQEALDWLLNDANKKNVV
ncbi:hypothetical protein [Psychroserpens damuponensis]|uniref:hypothetical protein n=1 Tax=Psychroserpens damuponensis TaxID=943936 RepID=UPI0005900142|nr:hypothetical protein [Psychroserpens damuponensis]